MLLMVFGSIAHMHAVVLHGMCYIHMDAIHCYGYIEHFI